VKPHLSLIRFIGLIVPRRLRADWRQEWEAELRYRELLLADWDRLNWKTKFDLVCRSLGRVLGCCAAATSSIGGRNVSRLALRLADVAPQPSDELGRGAFACGWHRREHCYFQCH
jgi:hypothetical protein